MKEKGLGMRGGSRIYGAVHTLKALMYKHPNANASL